MKKLYFLTLFFLVMATASFAQDYEVRSIEYLPEDMTAKVEEVTERVNGGQKCAVLRIATQNIQPEDRDEFIFIPDMGSRNPQRRNEKGEILLWVSPGITYLTIESKLGNLDIYFPDYLQGEVESLKTYRILIVGTRQDIPAPEIIKINKGYGSCQVVFLPTPDDAIVYLNGDSIGTGIDPVSTHPGINNWSIEHPLYHNESGTIVLSKGKTDTIDIALTPAYGYMRIIDDYGLDDEVKVYLDGEPVGNVPYESEKMASGIYYVAFERSDALIATGQIEVKENHISIEGVKGLIDLYNYKRENNDLDEEGNIADSLSKVVHTQFIPITGEISINSVPTAVVNIDGNNYGNTPLTIENLAVGTHDLTLTSSGCSPLTKKVSVREGKKSIYNLQLPKACMLTIESDQHGDIVHVDNEYVGRTPITLELAFGKHSVMLNRVGKYEQTKEIDLSPEKLKQKIQFSFGQYVDIETEHRSRLYVDGDYMGRTPIDLYLPHGKHKLRVESGWKAGSKLLNIEEGKTIDNIKMNTYYEKPSELLSHGAFFMTGNVAMLQSGLSAFGFNIGDIANGGQAGWFFSIMANGTFLNQLTSKDFSLFNAWMTANENGHIQNYSQEQLSDESSTLRGSALFGVALKIAGPVYLRIGAGAGIRHFGRKTVETNQWVVIDPYSWKGFEASLGMQCCLYNFVLNADALISDDVLTESKKQVEIRAGFGYYIGHKRSKR